MEINATVSPETAAAICGAIVEKLADVGNEFLALKGLRALTVVSQLASMTDTECDFLDGSGVREWCRLVVNGGTATVPRVYGDEDRKRAIDAIREINAGRKSRTEMGEMVDLIAGALGMTKVGG